MMGIKGVFGSPEVFVRLRRNHNKDWEQVTRKAPLGRGVVGGIVTITYSFQHIYKLPSEDLPQEASKLPGR